MEDTVDRRDSTPPVGPPPEAFGSSSPSGPPPEAFDSSSPSGPPPETVASSSPSALDHVEDDLEEQDLEDNGKSLPSPEEMKTETPTSSAGGGECWHAVGFFTLLVVMTALIVGLSVGLTGGDKKDGNHNDYDGSSSSGADAEKRKVQFKSYFIENGINVEEDFEDELGARSKAIKFLAQDDQRRLALPEGGLTTEDGYALLTRYVMTIIYYANNGKSWDFEMLFVSSHDTCEWFEVFPGSLGQVGVLCNDSTRQISGLSFISNKLEGTLPREIGYLTTINYLESIGNALEGTLPSELGKLTGLETLVMAGGSFGGPLPAWLSGMPNLEFVYLSNNNFSGTIPSSWSNLAQMSVLALDDNELNGSLDVVWQLEKLQYLYAEDNDFEGQLPTSIAAVSPFLVNLDISSNKLDGKLPTDLFRLSNLKILDLHGNQFTGSIPTDIPENDKLVFIAMFNNGLTGNIPPNMGNLGKVTHLDLAGNALQGTIPFTLEKMADLEILFLSSNPFTKGPIPTFLYDYENLVELSLKDTKRDGDLLHLVSFWDKLILLDLDNNELSGTIPTQIGEMDKLQFLLLNRNQFNGDVPTQLGALTDLRVFMLDRNNVTGDLQPACDVSTIQLAAADCQEVACECCDPCCTDDGDCHDFDLVANISPSWELSYERQFFDFSAEAGNFNVGDDDEVANAPEP